MVSVFLLPADFTDALFLSHAPGCPLSLKEGLPDCRPSTQALPLGAWEQSRETGGRTALQGQTSETPFQASGFALRGHDCSLEITDLQ